MENWRRALNKYELLIRAMHTAQSAREKGLENTAASLDNLVKRLSILIDTELQPNSAEKLNLLE